MKTGLFIQARLSSQRLPGKMLLPIADRPLLQWVLDAVSQVQDIHQIAVLTSDQSSDDPIADFCEQYGVACFRGDLENVAQRFVAAAKHYDVDAFVRINGDSPLMSPMVIQQAVNLFKQGEFDVITNVKPRSFPKGVSVEVLRTKTYLEFYSHFTHPDDFEHVTHYFYKEQPSELRLLNFMAPQDWRDVRFVVDTPADMTRIQMMFERLESAPWAYDLSDLASIYKEVTEQHETA